MKKSFYKDFEQAILITLLEERLAILVNHRFLSPHLYMEKKRIEKMLENLQDEE